MAVTKESGRQYALYADVVIDYDDLTSAVAAEAIDLPAGAIVTGGFINILTVWNSATSDVLDIGDGADVDRYTPTPLDIDAAVGMQAITVTGFEYTANDTIDVIWTGVSTAPTTGQLHLVVEYILDGRANENMG